MTSAKHGYLGSLGNIANKGREVRSIEVQIPSSQELLSQTVCFMRRVARVHAYEKVCFLSA